MHDFQSCYKESRKSAKRMAGTAGAERVEVTAVRVLIITLLQPLQSWDTLLVTPLYDSVAALQDNDACSVDIPVKGWGT